MKIILRIIKYCNNRDLITFGNCIYRSISSPTDWCFRLVCVCSSLIHSPIQEMLRVARRVLRRSNGPAPGQKPQLLNPTKTPQQKELESKYGKYAKYFEKELPPHIKYQDTCMFGIQFCRWRAAAAFLWSLSDPFVFPFCLDFSLLDRIFRASFWWVSIQIVRDAL
jgi:hypothetical protein